MHLVLSEYLVYILIFGENMHKGLVSLLSLQSMKYLKSCLPKIYLLGATILSISVLFFKTGALYEIGILRHRFFNHFYVWL